MICDDKLMARAIGEELARGLAGATISRLMGLRGHPVSAITINEHRKHRPADQVPEGIAKGKDLAKLIQDETFDAIQRGDLSIMDEKLWKNVGPGLKATAIIDKRIDRTDNRKTAIALAILMAGGEGGFLAPPALRIDDGLTIEGEAVEVDDD